MLACNHEPYIRQALDSALAQDLELPFEIVVGLDASSDRTAEIVLEYAGGHPDVVRVLQSERRVGAQRNFRATWAACRGKYIAILDGDDYWTDSRKLSAQVGFLERHPEYVLSFHNVRAKYEGSVRDSHLLCLPSQKAVTRLEDLLESNFIPSCSAVVRKTVHQPPPWILSLSCADWPMWVLATSQGGLIGYIDTEMAVYRRHAGGVSSRMTRSYVDGLVRTLRTFDRLFHRRFHARLMRSAYRLRFVEALDALGRGDRWYARFRLGELLLMSRYRDVVSAESLRCAYAEAVPAPIRRAAQRLRCPSP